MAYIKGKSREQMEFVSNDMLIPKDSPVRLIDLLTKRFYEDNRALLQVNAKGNSQTGRRAYSPITLLNLLVYGYFNGISSSRKLEKATYVNIEVKWLIEDLHPDHWTICAFRRENEDVIQSYIQMFRRFLIANQYADGSKIVFDGSKMKAYASRKMLTKAGVVKQLEEVESSIKQYLDELERVDVAQDAVQQSENELEKMKKEAEEIEAQVNALKKKKRKLERANKKLKNKKYVAPNDQDAVLVKGRDGSIPGYNVQTGVDETGHFIMSSEATTKSNDHNLLEQNIATVSQQTGQVPTEISADKGYGDTQDIINIEKRGIECFIPLGKTSKEIDAEKGLDFKYDKQTDTYICPNNKTLKLYRKNKKHKDGQLFNVYKCYECKGCPLRSQCTTSETGREIGRRLIEDQVEKYKASLKTEKAKHKINNRKQVVEHPFGTIKLLMGKFNFLLTGQQKVQIEVNLYAMAYNLKRLMNMEKVCQLMSQIENHNWKLALNEQ